MMPSYVLEWSVERGGTEKANNLFKGRIYRNDRDVKLAALSMFRARTNDANDELRVFEGRVNGWGCIEGHNGGDPRFVGKVAYNSLGTRFQFFSA